MDRGQRAPSLLRLIYFTTVASLRYWTIGTWVRLKWHYCKWRGKKYYL